MSDLVRRIFPSTPEEGIFPAVELREEERDQSVDAWADRHPHATIDLWLRYQDHGVTVHGRYCSECQVIRSARYELPYHWAPDISTWRVWLDVLSVLAVALGVLFLTS